MVVAADSRCLALERPQWVGLRTGFNSDCASGALSAIGGARCTVLKVCHYVMWM
jgi:hypothetical protein